MKRFIMLMGVSLVTSLAIQAYANTQTLEMQYFEGPVTLRYSKQNFKGMEVEGYSVRNGGDNYVVTCNVKNGQPGIYRHSDGHIEEATLRPAAYLGSPKRHPQMLLQWAVVCRPLVKW